MFFSVSQIEQSAHDAAGLQNPKQPGNPMTLGVYRQLTRTAFFSAYSKKAFGEFWDDALRQKIASRFWTPEMNALAKQRVAQAPKPPYVIKLTVVGWLFLLFAAITMGMIVYQELKPPLPKSAEYVAMEQAPAVGDVYFGHYEVFKEAGDRVASGVGFGWFKVINVEGDVYHMAKSVEMSNTHKPQETLNSTDFEAEGTPARITEQAGYLINMKATDGKMEIYITAKK